MRLADFPLISEVKDEYIKKRQNGVGRLLATQQLIQEYYNEITVGEADDGIQFWIGLADAQYHCRELTEEIAAMGFEAIKRGSAANNNLAIAQEDFQRRIKWYAQAPMPEQKIRKKRRFRCNWNIGDTFAYKVSGDEADELGILGDYFLFRKVSEFDFGDGRLLPVVTVTKWDHSILPTTAEEFQRAPMLKINNGGRCGSPKTKYEYRAEILFRSAKQIDSLHLQYLGNFMNVELPDDEIIFSNPGYLTLLDPNRIDQECCVFWKMHLYCTFGTWNRI